MQMWCGGNLGSIYSPYPMPGLLPVGKSSRVRKGRSPVQCSHQFLPSLSDHSCFQAVQRSPCKILSTKTKPFVIILIYFASPISIIFHNQKMQFMQQVLLHHLSYSSCDQRKLFAIRSFLSLVLDIAPAVKKEVKLLQSGAALLLEHRNRALGSCLLSPSHILFLKRALEAQTCCSVGVLLKNVT